MKAVTAPAASTLEGVAARAEERGPRPSEEALPSSGLEAPQPARPSKWSVAGWIALGAMILAVACTLYAKVVVTNIAGDLTPQGKTPEEIQHFQKAVQQEVAGRPGLMAAIVGACALPVLSVLCAIVALVARARPRWPAILALGLVGLEIVLVCAGALVQAMGRAPPGG